MQPVAHRFLTSGNAPLSGVGVNVAWAIGSCICGRQRARGLYWTALGPVAISGKLASGVKLAALRWHGGRPSTSQPFTAPNGTIWALPRAPPATSQRQRRGVDRARCCRKSFPQPGGQGADFISLGQTRFDQDRGRCACRTAFGQTICPALLSTRNVDLAEYGAQVPWRMLTQGM